MVIASELFTNISSLSLVPQIRSSVATRKLAPQDIEPPFDAWVAAIDEHPLFTPDRQAQIAAANALQTEAPPEMPGRLAGMMVNLGAREALFAPDGEHPVAVREGQEIGGWTVLSITSERVVLKNRFGEQTIEPTKSAETTAAPQPVSTGNKHAAPQS